MFHVKHFLALQEIVFYKAKKRSARMNTAEYKLDIASDRRRRENVPRYILCSNLCKKNKSKNRENNRKNYFHFYMDLLEMKVL